MLCFAEVLHQVVLNSMEKERDMGQLAVRIVIARKRKVVRNLFSLVLQKPKIANRTTGIRLPNALAVIPWRYRAFQ